MTVPHLMNCQHADAGWCVECVAELGNENWRQRDEIAAMREAIRQLMQGCEFKTIQGCEAWHRKSIPTDSALDAGRHAIGLGAA